MTPVVGGAGPIGRLLRSSLIWAVGVGGTTASIGAVGRLFCLPPYWPSGSLGRCRPSYYHAALQAGGDVLVTTALLVLPLLPLAAALQLASRGVAAWTGQRVAAVAVGLAGALIWVLLARRMEVSYLDFILGGYAIGAGALVGLLVSIRVGHAGPVTSRTSSPEQ